MNRYLLASTMMSIIVAFGINLPAIGQTHQHQHEHMQMGTTPQSAGRPPARQVPAAAGPPIEAENMRESRQAQ